MSKKLNRRKFIQSLSMGIFSFSSTNFLSCNTRNNNPNILLIYADDLGYGDTSCYNAKRIKTPNIDNLASNGLLFTNAHASSATCTPSRYSLLTGEYAWRRNDTKIAKGNASAIIKPNQSTIATIFKNAGYNTGVVGKWHLGLGTSDGADWNGEIQNTPLDIGFNYSFLIPATGDRVPCVYIENRKVVNLDISDPIKVSFNEPILDEPTGKDHPELLKMLPSNGHSNTIINGISRIGYMKGGKAAWWKDEYIADTITEKAITFIKKNKEKPFFLYFSTHDIHVPRIPHKRFAGKSGLGARGDAILQFDWCVGELLNTLEKLNLSNNTLVILTSDNGPVVDDGYHDQSVELLNGHKPAGPLRGGKYSAFDAGTRIPFIVHWPGQVKNGQTKALFSQIDLFATLASLIDQEIPENAAPDSKNQLSVLLGKSSKDRDYVIEHSSSQTLSIIKDEWKYIEPSNRPAFDRATNIELGNNPDPQLYNLKTDLGEKVNLASKYPEKLNQLKNLLNKIKLD